MSLLDDVVLKDAKPTPENPIVIKTTPTSAEVDCGYVITDETVRRVIDAANKLEPFSFPPRIGNSITMAERELIADHQEAIILQAFRDTPESDQWDVGLQLAAYGAFRFGLSFRRVSQLARTLDTMRPGACSEVRLFTKRARSSSNVYFQDR